MSATAHSSLGASGAKRWIACPASVAACSALPPEPESAAAREGTNAHAWAEFCLANGETDCDGYIGTEAPSAELAAFPPLTKEMSEAVNVYLEHVWSILLPEDELYVEQRLSLEFVAPGMFGTNDCSILKPDGTLHVLDYKHGRGVFVSAEDNPQVKYYALGALHLFRGRGVSRVVTWIVQPRCSGEPIRSAEYDALELWEWAEVLRVAAERTRQPGAAFNPGDHCASTFCAARFTCEAFRKKARAVACDGMDVVTDPETLPADDMAARLAEVDLLRAWCNAIEERAEREALAGNLPLGFKWVAGRGQRAWALSEDEAIAAVKAKTGIDISEIVCLSPAKAEAAVGKKKFAETCAGLVTTKNAKPSLVRESDKRPAISLNEQRTGEALAGMQPLE